MDDAYFALNVMFHPFQFQFVYSQPIRSEAKKVGPEQHVKQQKVATDVVSESETGHVGRRVPGTRRAATSSEGR